MQQIWGLIQWPFESLVFHLHNAFARGGRPDPSLTPLPSVERLSPCVVRVLGQNPGKFTLQGTNTYVIGAGRRRILVDAGAGVHSYLAILEETLQQLDEDLAKAAAELASAPSSTASGADEGGAAGSSGREGAVVGGPFASLDAVLVTHRHIDHVGGLGQLLARCPSLKVYKLLVPGEVAVIPGARGHEYLPLKDGQTFSLPCGTRLTLHHLPGHSSDHCCLWLEEAPPLADAEALEGSPGGAAFLSGDNVLGEGSVIFERLGPYMRSLTRMERLLERHCAEMGVDDVQLYPGHGPVVTPGRAKIASYIRHRQDREDQVLAAVRASRHCGMSTYEVVDAVYEGLPRAVRPAAAWSAFQHLEKLEEDGAIAHRGGKAELERYRERCGGDGSSSAHDACEACAASGSGGDGTGGDGQGGGSGEAMAAGAHRKSGGGGGGASSGALSGGGAGDVSLADRWRLPRAGIKWYIP